MSEFLISALLAVNVTGFMFGLCQSQDRGRTFRVVYLLAPAWFIGYYIFPPIFKFLFKERL